MQVLRTTIQHLQLTEETSKMFTFHLSLCGGGKAFIIYYATLINYDIVHSIYCRDIKLKHLIFGSLLTTLHIKQ